MTLIILRAANGHIIATSRVAAVHEVARPLPHPVTAYHWREVDPHRQDEGSPVWGWMLEGTETIA